MPTMQERFNGFNKNHDNKDSLQNFRHELKKLDIAELKALLQERVDRLEVLMENYPHLDA